LEVAPQRGKNIVPRNGVEGKGAIESAYTESTFAMTVDEPQPLPDFLGNLFWEYDFADLDRQEDHDLIVGRILTRGSWDAVRWLRREEGEEAIRGWIERTHGRPLDRRRLRYWQLVLDLPGDEVDAWLAAREPDVWERRTTG